MSQAGPPVGFIPFGDHIVRQLHRFFSQRRELLASGRLTLPQPRTEWFPGAISVHLSGAECPLANWKGQGPYEIEGHLFSRLVCILMTGGNWVVIAEPVFASSEDTEQTWPIVLCGPGDPHPDVVWIVMAYIVNVRATWYQHLVITPDE